MNEFVYAMVMSAELQLFLKAIGGVLTGLLVSTGHLDASNQDGFSQNINTIAGAIVTVISAFYLLEHAFQSAKEELKWSYTDTKPTTPEAPATPETPPSSPA